MVIPGEAAGRGIDRDQVRLARRLVDLPLPARDLLDRTVADHDPLTGPIQFDEEDGLSDAERESALDTVSVEHSDTFL